MLDLAAAALGRALYLSAEEFAEHRDLLCGVWGYRAIGAMAGPATSPRRWVLVRPGIERPLDGLAHRRRLVLVFDLNGVLGAKWFDPSRRLRCPRHCHVRSGPVAFFLRPGASKLLRICDSAGHEVWIWSTMQRETVTALTRALAPWLPPGRVLCGSDCASPDTKDLRRVWADSGIAGPDVASRTLLMDDDGAKGKLQPACVRQVPQFAPEGPFDTEAVVDRGALWMLAQVARAQLGGPS